MITLTGKDIPLDKHRLFDIGAELINHGLGIELIGKDKKEPHLEMVGFKIKMLGIEIRSMGNGQHVIDKLIEAGVFARNEQYLNVHRDENPKP